MIFCLTSLVLTKFLTKEALVIREKESDKEKVIALDALKHSESLHRNKFINRLDYTLYNEYCYVKTVGELSESLEKKYKTKNT